MSLNFVVSEILNPVGSCFSAYVNRLKYNLGKFIVMFGDTVGLGDPLICKNNL